MKKLNVLFIVFLSVLFSFGNTVSASLSGENGFKETVNSVEIQIEFYSPEIVRIVKVPTGNNFRKESFSVVKQAEKVDLQSQISGDEFIVSSSKIAVHLNRKTGKISFFSSEKKLLLAEKDYGIHFTPIKDVDDDSYVVKQSFVLDKDEMVYGLGQHQDGNMSQRNQKIYLLQDILITAIPVMHSNKGYGVFWDNYSPGYFTDSPHETSFESTVGDCADYYFMYGENADGVIAQMRALTGQAPMFPYWTYGYWQSKERYKSQDETVGVVQKYRELGVPLDGIIQDWQYWSDNYHWNAMEFLNPKFPDPQKMVDQIHDLNAKVIFSIWSSFGPKTKPYQTLSKKNMLLDFTTYPVVHTNIWPQPDTAKPSGVKVYDAYHPEARDIYWSYLKDGIYDLGVDGWWMDSTEPDHFERKDEDYNTPTYLGSFRKYRNLFPLMTVGGVYDHQRETSSDKRVFILTRSAYAGQQRYGANAWSGDVVTDWTVLRNQISAGLNFSLTGLPHWNSDIGGFFTWKFKNGVQNPAFREIYVRWLQFGTFCPMMRSHGTDTPREIYQFGEKGTWAYDAIEKFINLRYRLLPYTYSVSWDVTANASSMMRALMMDFGHDRKALDINDQYMFGKSILVCPVTEPMYTENDGKMNPPDFSVVKSRKSYLPAGTKWIDFWTGETFEGGQNVEKQTPIDIMPLYIKAGSVIPMGEFVQYANEKKGTVELRIYPGADAHFVLYDDERDNYNYEKGEYATIDLQWNDAEKKLTIGERVGSYKGMPKKITFNIVVVTENKGLGIELPPYDKTLTYKGKKVELEL